MRILITILLLGCLHNLKAQTIYWVTNTNDSGTGSLRAAITSANANQGEDVINFNISVISPIILTTQLPDITEKVTIDGTTQSGYQLYSPIISIDGQSQVGIGFNFKNHSSSVLKGLNIKGFNTTGVRLNNCDSIEVSENVIEGIGNHGIWIGLEFIGENYDVYYSQYSVITKNIIKNTSIGISISAGNTGFTTPKPCIQNRIGGDLESDQNIIYNVGQGIASYDDAYYNLWTKNKIFNCTYPPIGGLASANNSKQAPVINNFNSGVLSGTADAYDVVEIFGSTGTGNANEYYGTTNSDINGNWSMTIDSNFDNLWPYYTSISTDSLNNSSPLSNAIQNPIYCYRCNQLDFTVDTVVCVGQTIQFTNTSSNCSQGIAYSWMFGDGLGFSVAENPVYTYWTPGVYTVQFNVTNGEYCDSAQTVSKQITVTACKDCDHCISSFSLQPGEKYVLSAWVKEKNATPDVVNYLSPVIQLDFVTAQGTVIAGPFGVDTTQNIIDGWQQIEAEFTVPQGAISIDIKLKNNGLGSVNFDDIRIHPFSAAMRSFVYDPLTLRLTAELDDRNYATFYEYDENGNLVRVKKETINGIKTISETRTSFSK